MTRYSFAIFFNLKEKLKRVISLVEFQKIIGHFKKYDNKYLHIAVWVVPRVNLTFVLSFVRDLQVHCARLSQICIFSVFACNGQFC